MESEDPVTGVHKYAASAHLTFLAVDEAGDPQPVPPVAPETDTARRRHASAEKRRTERPSARKAVLAREAAKEA